MQRVVLGVFLCGFPQNLRDRLFNALAVLHTLDVTPPEVASPWRNPMQQLI
jgi:hypothetical protein